MFEFSSEKAQAQTYVHLQRCHMLSVFVWIPIGLTVVIFSCVWSNISGQNTKYVNLSTQWQACLTQAQYVTVPLNATLTPIFEQVTSVKAGFSTCIIDLVGNANSTCSTDDGFFCVLDIQSGCTPGSVEFPVVDNAQLPVGQLLNALSYIGIQALIFSALGIGSLYRALKHPSWLPSTIALLIWCLFAVFTYYTVNPILPVPTQTNSTLLIILQYISSNQKFTSYNNGNNHCSIAYNYLWIYATLILLLASLTLFNIFLAIFAELIKFNNPHKKKYESLEHTKYPNYLAGLSACFYLLVAFAKAYSSSTTLTAVNDFNVPIKDTVSLGYKLWYPSAWFPFQQPNLDFATILYLASFMSIIRGYTIQSVFAYKISFATALIYAISTYPTVVGGLQFYTLNNFQDYNNCYNYFLSDANKAFFGYPNEDQAKAYCGAFRSAVAGSLGLFISLHAIAFACLFTFYKNRERESMVIEQFDPEQYGVQNPVTSFLDPKPTSAKPSIDSSNTLTTPFVKPNEVALT